MENSQMRCLVVDDFEMIRTMLKKCLVQNGIQQIDEAEDGKQALEKIKQAVFDGKPYNIIFSDWNMPVMTGIDLLKMVKSSDVTKTIPFIMVTSEGEREAVLQAIKLGANDFIVKPFTADIIQKKLAKVFGKG